MNFEASWIAGAEQSDACPVFRKRWKQSKQVKRAVLYATAVGVYEARLNGQRVGEYVLAPGWTAYRFRLQYQEYEVTGLLREENELLVTVGKGWAISPMPGFAQTSGQKERAKRVRSLFSQLVIEYEDGDRETLCTDGTWEWAESSVRFSEIYDGEYKDASYVPEDWKSVQVMPAPSAQLIPQEGEEVREMERIGAKRIFTTPAGETVVDFGQEITGYVELSLNAKEGDAVHLLHGEVLDGKGNFYNANYRTAKAELTYICRDGWQTWHPQLTFFGFRYIKLDHFPGKPELSMFTGIAVYSNVRRTGRITTSSTLLNRLISNIFWGQKGNFLDVPTDCPQRDERLGWTGDAQVFAKAASYNYDVDRFFAKWLHDMAADQRPDGAVGQVIPDYLEDSPPSAAWGDAAVICPWQMYLTYGDRKLLKEQFPSMKRWVDYIGGATQKENLWIGGTHFGDWLGLDAPSGSYKGSTREDFIASAFYAHSMDLLIRAGRVLGEDVSGYEEKYPKLVEAFQSEFPEYRTQTECILAAWFGLAKDPQGAADQLAQRILDGGMRMETGFVGTPYLLHVLSRFGHADIAWSLLLREDYPSWLYPVKQGATTVWEHWDGIMEDGSFWSEDMNSFNHYAYGAVADWLYEVAAGIRTVEEAPGFERIEISPMPDRRLEWMEASIETRRGLVSCGWQWIGEDLRYTVTVPSEAVIRIDDRTYVKEAGTYTFWGK